MKGCKRTEAEVRDLSREVPESAFNGSGFGGIRTRRQLAWHWFAAKARRVLLGDGRTYDWRRDEDGVVHYREYKRGRKPCGEMRLDPPVVSGASNRRYTARGSVGP